MFVEQTGGWSRLLKRLRNRHPVSFRTGHFHFAWMLFLAPLIFLESAHPRSAQVAYEHALKTFQHGYLAMSEQEAEIGYKQFQTSDPAWAAKFQLLEARAISWQGKFVDAERLLATYRPSGDPEDAIHKQLFEERGFVYRHQFSEAGQMLMQVDHLCKDANFKACGDLLIAHGVLADLQGQTSAARQYYLDSIAFVRRHHDRWTEAIALANVGKIAFKGDRNDDALDWLRASLRIAEELDAKRLAESALGNLAYAYSNLGDKGKALEMYLKALKLAIECGEISDQMRWTENIGAIYQAQGDAARATQFFHQSLNLARGIDSKQDIIYSLEGIVEASLGAGKAEDASAIMNQLASLVHSNGSQKDALYLMMLRGMLASARRQDQQAEALLRTVDKDPASSISMRLRVGLEMAGLFEREGRIQAAEGAYKAGLTNFESARAQLQHEDSKLTFLAIALRLYDNYIHLLVEQGRIEEALSVASQSRARTLEQGLGLVTDKKSFHPEVLDLSRIAQKARATMLFYWLGEKQSYLWAITPGKTVLFPLPAQAEIASRVERYRRALLDIQNPQEAGASETDNLDGRALFTMLVAPASHLIRSNLPVMILADGALNQLNFETLLAPGPVPGKSAGAATTSAAHYWIEDATILSTPSFSMIASPRPASKAQRKLLLMGDALSYGEDYPELPMAGMEMKLIQKHFDASRQTVFARHYATPAAYLASSPEKFSFIHFVAHGTASSTDPLDSAIILSRSTAEEDSFKLYAHEIIQHPIDAGLVTISSCNGSGTRTYAGEGLVGLSWAFLRAGAHNVIAALWEVSDNATPRLMDDLYRGLEAGQPPYIALRAAKLNLLHSSGNYRAPFYWASFQIYTGY